MERSRLVCLWRAIKRVLQRGEAHRFGNLPKVLAFISNFDRVNRRRIEAARIAYGDRAPVARLASDRQIAEFVRSLEP